MESGVLNQHRTKPKMEWQMSTPKALYSYHYIYTVPKIKKRADQTG